MSALNVAVVQLAASLDPAENREALGVLGSICSQDPKPDLVVFPEAIMRDFGNSGSDVSEFAEDLDGPFVKRLTELAGEHGVTVVAGMFERSADPERPYNTLVVVDGSGVRASYRKIHLYDSFGYKESDRLLAGDLEPVVVEVGDFTVGLMTCYDLRFPELARMLVDAAPSCSSCPPPGSPDRSSWTTGGRCSRRGRSRTPCTSPRRLSRDRATPATRWSSHHVARSWRWRTAASSCSRAWNGRSSTTYGRRTRRSPTDASEQRTPN